MATPVPPPLLAESSFVTFLQEDPASSSVAAIKALTENIRSSGATTMMGLIDELRRARDELRKRPDAPISIASLCELFVRFVTRTALEGNDFDATKRALIERGEMLVRTTLEARSKIAKIGAARSCVCVNMFTTAVALLRPPPLKPPSPNVVTAFRKAAHAASTSGRRSGFHGNVRTEMNSASIS